MNQKTERFTAWHGLLLAETIALMIGLLMPITPSKTGSGHGLAHHIIPDPSYLQEVFVYFVLTNLLLIFIGIVIAVCWKFGNFQ
ncbi:MAG: hypothetical protein V2J55_00360 [Candidatus Competibacteraceae bacterium]|jgi:hypothetical protein|nr:hypothetical protein [Candidatus Competibacteraceae bacterium]